MGRNNRRSNRGRAPSSGNDTGDDEPFIDRYTGVDEQLEVLINEMRDLGRTNAELATAIAGLSGTELELPERNDLPLVADAVIEPQVSDDVSPPSEYDGNTETVDLSIPTDGTVSQVYLSFPAGANQSIGIGIVGTSQESLVPFGPSGVKYVALDDKTVEFSFDYAVSDDETVTARFINERVAETADEIEDLTAYASAIVVVTEEV